MKVLIKAAWGSDESTKACFAFLHANAFAEAGHQVQIFLLGEAVIFQDRHVAVALGGDDAYRQVLLLDLAQIGDAG